MELKSVDLYRPKSVFATTLDEVEESLSLATGFEHYRVPGEDIHITDDGMIEISGEEKLMTEESIRSLCKELKIPDPFAKRIPLDTLQYNIHRLSRGRQFEVFTSNTNNHWVNFVDPEKLSSVVEVSSVMEAVNENKTFSFKRAEINELGVSLFYEDPTMIKPVKVNDLVSFGWQVRVSESGFGMPSGSVYSLRLTCTNGAVAPSRYGSFRYPKRGEPEIRLNGFLADLANSRNRITKFAEAYKQVASGDSELPSNRDFNRVWGGVRKTLRDPDLADIVLGIDKETRLAVKRTVKEERDLFAEDDENEGPIVPLTWYELINKVTEAPQSLKLNGRSYHRMQVLGGKLIDFAIRQVA